MHNIFIFPIYSIIFHTNITLQNSSSSCGRRTSLSTGSSKASCRLLGGLHTDDPWAHAPRDAAGGVGLLRICHWFGHDLHASGQIAASIKHAGGQVQSAATAHGWQCGPEPGQRIGPGTGRGGATSSVLGEVRIRNLRYLHPTTTTLSTFTLTPPWLLMANWCN